eukprot:TRINITY_DN40108_c0_g1_i1.p1 TRINITY_DN40108_c0_g1~~TRINITY_DN40108_c0_g1_i1.p1  ORF type:complete len:333 (-),score=100.33 TRINITY_DN40108_c0_g1_i1:106-1104(-)
MTEGLQPYCFEETGLSKSGALDETDSLPSAYADALKERLQKVRAEVQLQVEVADSLRKELDDVRAEADTNFQELALLRSKWAEEQPRREALLRETGDTERRLAEKERRCAEVLAAHAASEFSRGGNSAPGTARGESTEAQKRAQGSAQGKSRTGDRVGLEQQRQQLASLEALRVKLSAGLQELRDAVRQESAAISQLSLRGQALRKETKAIRNGAAAAKESEARALRKLEAMDSTEVASQQRLQALERQAHDLRDEVRSLRGELDAASAPPPAAGLAEAAVVGGQQSTRVMNRRLQEKVDTLREELRKKEEWLQKLRSWPPGTAAAPAMGGQ